MLSDSIADTGRSVRLRYCNTGAASSREEELPMLLDMQQALDLLQSTHETDTVASCRKGQSLVELGCNAACFAFNMCCLSQSFSHVGAV